ncbi:MAG: Ig-like domain-containing protein [Clostridium sp.]|nr:Ig-like domain-containing protein [Prevotella sp.]MCM1429112.1 Ig-like domain-containing protein [Clostridium sp.]MCM1475360.1 Ig-like domain-containing protein [Muribaculaceae bacterium]
MKNIFWFIILLFLVACASIGNPSGGPRDEEPPRFVRSNPDPGATNFSGDQITLYFNELVNVKDAFSKVVISPPSTSTPRVSSLGRRVTIKFEDTLRANTTYTIDFADAIEDNNENNPLTNFSYTFSTGPDIDSLGFSGMVLSAEALEPMQGKLIGLHLNHADSAIRMLIPDYVARTDDYGRFFFQGLKPGAYRVFALDDADGNRVYSSPEEEFGVLDYFVEPWVDYAIVADTIRNIKTGEIDTIKMRTRRMLMPNDVLLRSYTSRFKQQYMTKYERIDSTRLQFLFNSPSLSTPEFAIAGAPRLKDWAIMERSATNDTILLWLKPRSLVGADTLRVAVAFMATDSAMNLSERRDTLRMTFDRKKFNRQKADEIKAAEKKWKAEHKAMGDSAPPFEPPAVFMNINIVGSSVQEVNLPLYFETDKPLAALDTASFHLEIMQDSTWTPIAVDISQSDSLKPRSFQIRNPWKYETKYRLRVDSLAMTDIYGVQSRPFSHEFTTRAEGDYSSLTMRLRGLDPGIPAFVELLTQDKPVRRGIVADGVVTFEYLLPGSYYARMYEDYNGNSVYDPGDFDKGIEPDVSYYYPKEINLKKNWSKDETWDVFGTPINLQKPEAIRKNKPKQRHTPTPGKKKEKIREEEEDEE